MPTFKASLKATVTATIKVTTTAAAKAKAEADAKTKQSSESQKILDNVSQLIQNELKKHLSSSSAVATEEAKAEGGEVVRIFDFDGTLSTPLGKQLAQHEIKSGTTVYIISARSDASSMYSVADALGIPHSRVYATGSNIAKIEKIKQLGIKKHYDNNRHVIDMLPRIGVSFSLTEEETLTLIEAVIKDDSIPE